MEKQGKLVGHGCLKCVRCEQTIISCKCIQAHDVTWGLCETCAPSITEIEYVRLHSQRLGIGPDHVTERDMLSVLSSVQLDWGFAHGLDPSDVTKWKVQLRWRSTDGEHNYGACVELDDVAITKVAYSLIVQAHETLRVLKEQGQKDFKPGLLLGRSKSDGKSSARLPEARAGKRNRY